MSEIRTIDTDRAEYGVGGDWDGFSLGARTHGGYPKGGSWGIPGGAFNKGTGVAGQRSFVDVAESMLFLPDRRFHRSVPNSVGDT